MSGDAPTPALLDSDPGHDDPVAILRPLGSPGVRLLGITTCFGDGAVEDATGNAQRVLAVGRQDVPVAMDAARPMRGQLDTGRYWDLVLAALDHQGSA